MQWFDKSTWHKTTFSGSDNSRIELHSVLFTLRSSGFWCRKRRFHRQETVVLASRNGGSWNWFLFLYTWKRFIALIISVLCIMSKTSVFRYRTTMCRQISAVCMLRIAFLLNLFIDIWECMKRRKNRNGEILSTQSNLCKCWHRKAHRKRKLRLEIKLNSFCYSQK